MSTPGESVGAVADVDRFGRLVKVPARTGWVHEALDFTPWLAENLDRLGEAVGLALQLRDREHAVGRYSLDLLLEDAQERIVIVENQFGQTDHDHLGKLLTYCAGTDADVVIWIAETLNDEHVAALEWLNESTVAGVGFFGVELELLKIGNSLPAPHFKVLVQPNEWTKSVRPVVRTAGEWSWQRYADELGIRQERLAVGRSLVERAEDVINARNLAWQKRFRKGYVAFQRGGGYNVLLVDLWWRAVPRFAVKIPAAPAELGLVSPYPTLVDSWNPGENEWGWTVPSPADIPDLSKAVDLAMPFHPSNGPMILLNSEDQERPGPNV